MSNILKYFRKGFSSISNIIDEMANKFALENRFDELEIVLQSLTIENLNVYEKETYYILLGIFASKKKNHDQASEYFTQGLRYASSSQQLKFLLGQEYIYLSNPKKAFQLFDQCYFPVVKREYVLAMSRYAYLYNEYERGINYLEKFIPYYLDLKILDDQFIYARGLPLFGDFINHLSVHCLLGKNIKLLDKNINEFQKRCVGYDFDYIRLSIQAYESHDYARLIAFIKNKIEEAINRNLPVFYNELRVVCLKSASRLDVDEAIADLNSISHNIQNNEKFSNIALLARAAVENKFNLKTNEVCDINKFLLDQPLLLEPGLALEFGLLDYQEKLKLFKLSLVRNI